MTSSTDTHGAHTGVGARVPRLLGVDGNSLGHRAFHSTRADPDAGPEAVTGAVVSMLASTWRHGPYDALVVAFDHPSNRRKLSDPVYKANREATDPALIASLRRLRETLAAAGLPVVERDGAEADDVLAATVDACAARGWPCDLLSSDRDLLALVDERVRLLRPRATFTELVVEDLAAVRETYGIEPHQYPDMAALRGDPSDGLDGVAGVGPKTAARLVRDHGSVLGVYEALSDLPPKLEAALRAARERVERNVLLMAPLPHIEVDVDRVARRGVDLARVAKVLAELGETTAARRLQRAVSDPPPPMPPAPPEPSDEPDAEPQHARDRSAVVARRALSPLDAAEQAALFDE